MATLLTSTSTPVAVIPEPEGQEGEGTSPEQLHVLLIPTVMEHLFSHMDFVTLQTSRLVCRTWKEGNAQLIADRGVIRLDPEKHAAGHLENFIGGLEQMGAGGQQRYIHYIWAHSRWVDPFKTYFMANGNIVQSLILRFHFLKDPYNFTIDFLNEVLKACPNLEEVDFCLAKEFNDKQQILIYDGTPKKLKLKTVTINIETGINKHLLRDFINACAYLRSFTVSLLGKNESPNTSLMQDLFQLGESGEVTLANLHHLSVSWQKIITSAAAIQSMLRQELNLTYLCIELKFDVREDELAGLFRHLGGTLRTLILGVHPGIPLHAVRVEIPSCMEVLEWCEIRAGSNNIFIGPLESVVNANLPNLKTFILHRDAIHETRGYMQPAGADYDFNKTWSTLTPGWFNRRPNEHLETLQLPCGLTEAEHFLEVMTAFPKLLDLRLQNPSSDVIKAVFSTCTRLERLSIRLLMFPSDIDCLLTGLRPKICAHMLKQGKYSFKDPGQVKNRGPGLANMKNLREFELRQWEASDSLSEVSLWQGFMELKNAVKCLKVELNGCHQLSGKSIKALRSALGPKCQLIIADSLGNQANLSWLTAFLKGRICTKLCYWDFWAHDYDKHKKVCSGDCCNP